MTLTTVKAGAYLHHLELHSPEPERLARFYGDVMDMAVERREQKYLCAGPGRRVLVSEGPPKKLGLAAFACRDRQGLADIRERAEGEGLAPKGVASALLAQDAFSVTDPDGNVIVFGLDREEDAPRRGLKAPIQHLTLATRNVGAIEGFYADKLGFAVSDRVVNDKGKVMTSFMRSNHEHHTLGCFLYPDRAGIDHHSYEAGEWNLIRDWCDRFAERNIKLMWGPGRHGPGNNLFVFITDPDGNWIEVSAELEVVHDRPVKAWPHEERTVNLWGKGLLRA